MGVINYPRITKVKSADQTVNNSTTLVDDTELFIDIGPKEVWFFEFFIRYSCAGASGNTMDLKATVTGPASGDSSGITLMQVSRDQGAAAATTPEGFFFDGGVQHIGARASGEYRFNEQGAIITGWAENDSNTFRKVQFRFAQDALVAADLKVHKGSFLRAQRVV